MYLGPKMTNGSNRKVGAILKTDIRYLDIGYAGIKVLRSTNAYLAVAFLFVAFLAVFLVVFLAFGFRPADKETEALLFFKSFSSLFFC